MKVVKVQDKAIIVTDEMGSVYYLFKIRIFGYPCDSGIGLENGFMRCYANHLNYISTC